MNRTDIVGTWLLVSCTVKTSEGLTGYPWGQDSFGFLTYTDDGYVFVSRMSATLRDRGAEIEPGSPAEAKAVSEGFEAYCGTYELRDDTITHSIELCSTPAFIGTKQVRHLVLTGDQLALTTAPVEADGVTHTAYLVWRRAVPRVAA